MGSVLTPSDSELVSRVLSGDMDAFRLLAEKYSQALYGFALAILGNHHDAQDLAQAGLTEAYRCLGGFDTSRNFKGWLFGITRNLCFDHLKKRPREAVMGVGLDQFDLMDVEQAKQKVETEEDERLVSMRAKFAQLSEQYRVVLTLRYIEGISKTQIGKTLGISYDAVGQRLYRGLKDLKSRLITEISPDEIEKPEDGL